MSTEKKVGLFFLLSLISLAVLIEFVEDVQPFQRHVEYVAYFDSLVGLNVGDPVRLAGVQVGKVRSIDLDDHRIRLTFRVTEGTAVRRDSIAQVRQTNLLGGQFLALSFGSADQPLLPPGGEVATESAVNIDEMLANIDRSMRDTLGEISSLVKDGGAQLRATLAYLENITRKVDEGEGTIGQLVNDPALYHEALEVATNLRQLTRRIESGEGTIGQLMHNDQLYHQASEVVTNLRDITERMRQGEGSLGKLLTDDELHSNAVDALAGIRDVTAKVSSGEGSLGKLLHDDTLYDEAAAAMTRVNSIATKIDEGQGTVGRLVNDDELYREARTTINKVEKAVDGLSDTGPLSALGVALGTLF